MYISKIKLYNFKGFKGEHEILFDKGINFFVGDNNCGKSSVFEAIDFIVQKKIEVKLLPKPKLIQIILCLSRLNLKVMM